MAVGETGLAEGAEGFNEALLRTSYLDPLGLAIGPIGIDQCRARSRRHRLYLADEYMMRADAFRRRHAAIECHYRIGQARRARTAPDPSGAGELVAVLQLNAAAEAIGDVGLILTEHVHAERAVHEHGGGGAALVMDADQNGWAVSVGGDGRHG